MTAHNKYWTDDKLEWLRSHSNGVRRDKLCEMYNSSFNENIPLEKFIGACNRYHIRNNIDMKIKKGCVGWNKGKKQEEYMSPEAIERSKATRFKKGRGRHNGDIYIARYKSTSRVFIKLGDNKREKMLYDKYLYEKTYNVKLDDHARIVHLDGDYLNCDINNLMLVEGNEHLSIINKKDNYYEDENPQIKKAYITMMKLQYKARKLSKEHIKNEKCKDF